MTAATIKFDKSDIQNKTRFDFQLPEKLELKFSQYADDESKEKNKEEMPEECCIEFDMLRTGNFMRSSWFGEYMIKVTEEMMDSFIKNFNDKVVPTGVPLDVNHNREDAFGWLKSIRKETRKVKGKEQVYMIGNWSLNKKGQKVIKEEIYKFFSVEFRDNYADHEVLETTKDSYGNDIPLGSRTTYGPTLLGGALTNRPFIPNLNSIPTQFSENLNENEKNNTGYIFEYHEFSGKPEPIVVSSVKKITEKNPKENINLFSLKDFSLFSTKEKEMKFSASQKLISFMETQLSAIPNKESDDYKEALKALNDAKAEFSQASSELDNSAKTFNELSEANKKLSETVKDMSTKVVSFESKMQATEAELALQRERTRQSEIKSYCTDLATKGFPKPTIDKVNEILLSDTDNKEVIKFSDEKGEKTSASLRDVISSVLNTIPTDFKVAVPSKDSKVLEFNIGTKNIQDPVKETEMQQFMADNEDALKAGQKKAASRYKNAAKSLDVSSPPADPIPARK